MKAAFLSLILFIVPSQLVAQGGPSLISPADEATGVSINPTFRWNQPLGAGAFTLEVSTDPEFSFLTLNLDNLSVDSLLLVEGLEYNTVYYWRVGLLHGAALGLSEVRSFTTIIAPPTLPLLNFPANGETGVSTSLTLRWDSVSTAESYHIQVSSDEEFSSLVVDQDGVTDTKLDVSGLVNSTLYYWRVSATNVSGTSIFSTVQSFTTIITAPLAPLLALPADGATDISLTPTLSWNGVDGADSYHVQVSTNLEFTELIVNQTDISGTTFEVSGLANSSLYYWRVSATNAGGASVFSDVKSFTTIITAPLTPLLALPLNGALDVPVSAELSWNASLTADSYRLQVSYDLDFSSPLYDQSGLTGTSQVIPGLVNNTQYYWRVSAMNVGGTSVFSSANSFITIVAAPTAPLLTMPVDGALDISLTTTFNWNGVENAESYHLQVSTDTGFSGLILDQQGIVNTEFQIAGLLNSTAYYWRVSATNVGGTSAFSDVKSFATIIAAPLTPLLALPADGATNISLTPTLSWNGVDGADSYHVQVSTNLEFTELIVNQTGISGTTLEVSGLANSSLYYWKVSATNAGGTSVFSDAQSFTTIITAPLAPLLALPLNGATDVPVSAELSWNASLTTDSYQLQVSANPDFSPTVYDQSGLTGTSQVIPGLVNNTQYYWRVSATNVGGTSLYSAVQNFTTIIAAPLAPQLVTPLDGATNVPTEIEFFWSPLSMVDSYRLQVSTDLDFDSLVYDQDGLTDSLVLVAELTNNTQYFWRVSATNIGGTSLFSLVHSFTTIIAAPLAPLLALPVDDATEVPVNAELSWNISLTTDSYRLQVSTDLNFDSLVFDQSGLTDTIHVVDSLVYGTLYYWRISATNVGGTSLYSAVQSFTTMWLTVPVNPQLVSPVNGATDVSLTPTLSWNSVSYAETYFVEVSTDSNFSELVVNQHNIAGTEVQVEGLQYGTLHYWRVGVTLDDSINISYNIYSAKQSFTTIAAPTSVERLNNGIPETFALQQNFPNPFNPMTTIQFSVAKESRVTLAIFNMLGAMVEVLADQTFAPGNYQVQWTPDNLPSGVYFYRFRSADFTSTRKLLLLR